MFHCRITRCHKFGLKRVVSYPRFHFMRLENMKRMAHPSTANACLTTSFAPIHHHYPLCFVNLPVATRRRRSLPSLAGKGCCILPKRPRSFARFGKARQLSSFSQVKQLLAIKCERWSGMRTLLILRVTVYKIQLTRSSHNYRSPRHLILSWQT